MTYYKDKSHYYKVVSANKMISIYLHKEHLPSVSVDTFGKGNIVGEHSLLKNATQITEEEFESAFKEAKEIFNSILKEK